MSTTSTPALTPPTPSSSSSGSSSSLGPGAGSGLGAAQQQQQREQGEIKAGFETMLVNESSGEKKNLLGTEGEGQGEGEGRRSSAASGSAGEGEGRMAGSGNGSAGAGAGAERDVDMDEDQRERDRDGRGHGHGRRTERIGSGSGSGSGAGEMNRPNHPRLTLPSNTSSSPSIKAALPEISPTNLTAIDPSLSGPTSAAGMYDSQQPSSTSSSSYNPASSSAAQRPAQTGPTRTHSHNKPAPLNLRSISNSTVGSGTNNDVSLNSPYAGSYATRLGERPAQHQHAGQQQAGGNGRVTPVGEMNDEEDSSLRYPAAAGGRGIDRNDSISRPALMAHSASLPVLPSHGEASSAVGSPLMQSMSSTAAQGNGNASYSSYPGSAAPFNRAYSYGGYAQHEGNSAGTYEQGSQHQSPQVPPPFQHAYTSPAVPMYPSGGGHHYPTSSSGYPSHALPSYSHLHHTQQPQQQQQQHVYPSYANTHNYQPSGTMSSPSFMGSAATGGYPNPGGHHQPHQQQHQQAQNQASANSTPGSNGNTPGVLVIGANGQIMPHNAAQMVGGRGTPLSERPFKCDECVQSFNRNHDLKRHKRIHLDVKPFACEKCGKQFSRKDALRRHWLVKGCKASDDPNVNMANPAYQANKPPPLSPPTPENGHPPSMGSHSQQSAQSMHNQHVYPNHSSMLRTPSYGGGPMVVTPDDEAFGGNGYSSYGPGQAHHFRPQGQQQHPMHVVSANTSPSSRPSGGSMSYAPVPQRNDSYDRMSTPGSAGIHHPNGSGGFPGQFDPNLASASGSQSLDSSKLPGRFSLDARLHPSTAAATHHERPEVGPRSASISMPISDGINRRGTPVMVVQADGMIEESVPGQNNVIKRISRDDYFEGVFTPNNGSNGMDQALDAYGAVSSSNAPKLANQSAGPPQFAMPFEKGSRPPNEPSTGPGSEAWSRWHRPSFPFPHASGNVYRTPDSMEDSTDLRKSISHRASVSQQNGGYPHGGPSSSHRPSPPSGQRWTRASFPFPDNPSNAMGIPPTAGGQNES